MKSEQPDLLAWLQLRRVPDFTQARWLGAVFGAMVFLLSVGVIIILPVLAISALVHLTGALWGVGPYADDNTAEAIRNIGLVLVGLIGAPFLVWRSLVAQKQVDVAEQSQITDRINKAVEGLGAEKTTRKIIETPRYQRHNDEWVRDTEQNLVSATRPDGTPIIDRETLEQSEPNLEVRIGAIYALERIAKDSMRDHIQIMEILCAYVRENARAFSTEPTADLKIRPVPRADIQSAITVIGRRSAKQLELEAAQQFRLDLRSTDLGGVDFRNGQFSAAMFQYCRFEAALFHNANLTGSAFQHTLLNYAEFWDAQLRGTNFDFSIINKPPDTYASINSGKIYGISLMGADISAIQFIPHEYRNLTFGSRDTKLGDELQFDAEFIKRERHKIRRLKGAGKLEEARTKEDTLYRKHMFVDWMPFDSGDGARSPMYKAFLDRLELKGWPYR